jgi:hypothetical protein
VNHSRCHRSARDRAGTVGYGAATWYEDPAGHQQSLTTAEQASHEVTWTAGPASSEALALSAEARLCQAARTLAHLCGWVPITVFTATTFQAGI